MWSCLLKALIAHPFRHSFFRVCTPHTSLGGWAEPRVEVQMFEGGANIRALAVRLSVLPRFAGPKELAKWNSRTGCSNVSIAVLSSYSPPGNSCFFTINNFATSPSAARHAKPNGFRLWEHPLRAQATHALKLMPCVRNAARKPLSRSAPRRDVLFFAGNVSAKEGTRPALDPSASLSLS